MSKYPARRREPEPEPTVMLKELPKFDRQAEPARWIDRRGDVPPDEGPVWYTPRYRFDDA